MKQLEGVNIRTFLLVLTAFLILQACGGSSGVVESLDNVAPVAQPQSVIVEENSSKSITLAGSDTNGDSLSFNVVASPVHGVFKNGTYTPEKDYLGDDSFTFVANDGYKDSVLATVLISIKDLTPPSIEIFKNANEDVIDTESGNAKFEIAFSEDVTGFSVDDINTSGGIKTSLEGSGSSYQLEVIPNKNSLDSIIISIPPKKLKDLHGNSNLASATVIQKVNTQRAFITTWKTDNQGSSYDRQIELPIIGKGYDYKVDWGDGKVESGLKGKRGHTYELPGTYTVKITGEFPRLFFPNTGNTDNLKLLSVEQWGTVEWDTMRNAFYNCYFLENNALDTPDLSNVSDMSYMFAGTLSKKQNNIGDWVTGNVVNMTSMFDGASGFNQDISSWDTSSVEDMSRMFRKAKSFNMPLNSWDVGKVTNMVSMFEGAIKFNKSLSGWDTNNVVNMSSMFNKAQNFNADIGSWVVGKVTDISGMFQNAIRFNQNLQNWDTSNISNMKLVFNNARKFNQDITAWDTHNVTNMYSMFDSAASFDQNLESWSISKVVNMSNMFDNTSLSDKNFNKLTGIWPLISPTR